MLKRVIVAVLFCLAISSAACADTIWSNGTPTQNSFWCNDCFNSGWVPYDDFQISSSATVTGFSFVSEVAYGAVYNKTDWYLWDAQPVTSSILTSPIATGTAIAAPNCGGTAHTGDQCSQAFTISALNLAPGTYWLGFANQFSSKSFSTIYNSAGSPLPGGDGQINWLTQKPNSTYVSGGDFAFTVEGSQEPAIPAVPEPATVTLVCSGLAAIAGLRRKLRG